MAIEVKCVKATESYAHVAFIGRLDLDGANAAKPRFDALVSVKGIPAIVELTECEFLSSMGMRLLLSAAKALRLHGAKLALYNPQPMVLEALRTAGFGLVAPICFDLDEALAIVRSSVNDAKRS